MSAAYPRPCRLATGQSVRNMASRSTLDIIPEARPSLHIDISGAGVGEELSSTSSNSSRNTSNVLDAGSVGVHKDQEGVQQKKTGM